MKHAFKALAPTGLLAVALAVMAFGAATAQAQPGAYWLVNGVDIGTTLLPEVQAEDDQDAKGNPIHHTFLTAVGKTPVEILCLEISFKGAKLHKLGRFTGKIHYNSCVTIFNKSGVPATNCKPHTPGAASGLIETNALEGLLKLHELAGGVKDELLELSPTTGTSFLTLELGALCAAGNKFDITGKLVFKDGGNEGLVDKVEHLFKEGPLSAILFGTNAMTIDGSFWMFLTGAHEGMTFAGHTA